METSEYIWKGRAHVLTDGVHRIATLSDVLYQMLDHIERAGLF